MKGMMSSGGGTRKFKDFARKETSVVFYYASLLASSRPSTIDRAIDHHAFNKPKRTDQST